MVPAHEAMAMIEAHGKRSRTEAELCRGKAKEARDRADHYARQHVGEGMWAKRNQIYEDGQAEAEQHEAEAARHDDRARTAEKGYLLHTSEDQRNPHYAMSIQSLLSAAGQHGLLRSEPL
jgi:hypothetical protein